MSELRTNRIIPRDGLTSGTYSGGGIIQVKQAVKTDTFSVTGTATSDITGMSISITPTRADSKILVSYHLSCSVENGGFSGFIFTLRDSTQIFLGDSAGSRQRCSSFINSDVGAANNSDYAAYDMFDLTGQFLDSPATTSAVTYKLQMRSLNSGRVFHLNRHHNDSDGIGAPRTASSLTVMEVSG